MSTAVAYIDSAPPSVRVRSAAKINLHLGVGPARPDGFHELTTVYQAISLYDEVTVSLSRQPGVQAEVTGRDADAIPLDETNLAVRAVRLLADHARAPTRLGLKIHKRIPVAGGLAGGSTDAAAALLAAARLWGLTLPKEELLDLAAELGSDVPFCLLGGTALGSGRGEAVREQPSRGRCHWVLAIAEGQLSTPKVYAEVDRLRAAGVGEYSEDVTSLLKALQTGDVTAVAPLLRNDMTEAALSLRPQLGEVLKAGAEDGALATLVSGSGPTALFLARDSHHAAALAGRLRMRRIVRDVVTAYGPVQGAHLH